MEFRALYPSPRSTPSRSSPTAKARRARRRLGVLVLGLLMLPDAMASNWSRSLRGSGSVRTRCVAVTSDGGALLAGSSVQGALLAKVTPEGSLSWSVGHGASRTLVFGLLLLPGDESLLVGTTAITAFDNSGWIARFDGDGVPMWDGTIVSPRTEIDDAAILTSGEIIVSGWSNVTVAAPQPVVLGLDPAGSLTWQLAVDQAPSGRVGVASSRDGGFVLTGTLEGDGFVAKFDASRRVEWQRRIGDGNSSSFTDAAQTDDGGFVLRGFTTASGIGGTWLVKVTAGGDVEWSAALGSAPGVGAFAVTACPDQGFLLSGGARGGAWGRIAKVDASGNLQWTVQHGSADARGHEIARTSDGGMFFVGSHLDPVTLEWSGWLLKLDAEALDPSACPSSPIAAQATRPLPDIVDTTYTISNPGLTMQPTPGVTTVRDIVAAPPRCPPGEVTGLRVHCTLPGATLTWDPVFEADEYEVYRGTLPTVMPLAHDHADVGACALPSTTWTDPGACRDGDDWYYLVIARNGAGRGPYGSSSLGVETPPAATECP